MIIKSLIALSIFFNFFGAQDVVNKLDDAIIREEKNKSGGLHSVEASDNNLNLGLPDISQRPRVAFGAPKPLAYARNYLLADPDSGVIIAKQREGESVPIASTTKIMTAVIAMENYQLDEVVTVSEAAVNQIGADSYLRVGEKISVENLLNCLLIKSGNDAAYALAEHMNKNTAESGVKDFIEKMNQRAKDLGMLNTQYKDPAGLDTDGFSSAYDLYLITKQALNYQFFKEVVGRPNYIAKNVDGTIWHQLDNSNRLVGEYNYPGAIGVKTGYMPEAGHCLVGAATREGRTLISIVLKTSADTPSASAEESRRLLDWGFANLEWK